MTASLVPLVEVADAGAHERLRVPRLGQRDRGLFSPVDQVLGELREVAVVVTSPSQKLTIVRSPGDPQVPWCAPSCFVSIWANPLA